MLGLSFVVWFLVSSLANILLKKRGLTAVLKFCYDYQCYVSLPLAPVGWYADFDCAIS